MKNMRNTELVSKRTRNSRTFPTGKGNFRTQISGGSLNYKDATGAWQPIDNTLVPGTANGLAVHQNRANGWTAQIPDDAASGPVRVMRGSSWVEFALSGARGAGSAKAAVEAFAAALPGVDVAVAATNDALQQTLTLHDASAPTSFSYQVWTSPDLKAREAASGIQFLDAAGRVQFSFTAPAMYESWIKPASGSPVKPLPKGTKASSVTSHALTLKLGPAAAASPTVTATSNPAATAVGSYTPSTTPTPTRTTVAGATSTLTRSTGVLRAVQTFAPGATSAATTQATASPTASSSPTATSTPVPSTATATATAGPSRTATPAPSTTAVSTATTTATAQVSATPTGTSTPTATATQLAGAFTVTLTADANWLHDPARKFPVVIDPDLIPWYFETPSGQGPLTSIAPGKPPQSGPPLEVISDSASGTQQHGLIQFPITSFVGGPSVQLLNADLMLAPQPGSVWDVAGSGLPTNIGVHQVTKPFTTYASWTSYDTVWDSNGQPQCCVNPWDTPGGDYVSQTVDGFPGPQYDDGTFWHWDVTGQVAKWLDGANLYGTWLDGSTPNYGFLLESDNSASTDINFYTWFCDPTVDPNCVNTLPQMMVTWESRNGQTRFGTLNERGQQHSALDDSDAHLDEFEHAYALETHKINDRLELQVNVTNGNVLLAATDLTIPGTGKDLKIQRFFNALAGITWDFGNDWTIGTGGDVGLQVFPTGSVVLFGPSGYQVPFVRNPDGSFTGPPAIDATMAQNAGGSFTLTFQHTGEKYNFDAGGYFTSDVDKNGNTIAFLYNASNQLASIVDTQGRVTTFAYNSSGFVSLITDPAGRTYQYGYDPNGNLTTFTDAAGQQTQMGYDAYWDLTQITDPNGNATKLQYSYGPSPGVDYLLQVTYVTNPSTGSGPSRSYGLSFGGKTTTVTDANGHTTTYSYDSDDNITGVVDALGNPTSLTYTPDSNVQVYTNAAQQVTRLDYNANNMRTATHLPTGATASWEYNDSSHPYYTTKFTNPQGYVKTFGYDAKGNVTSMTDGLGSQNQFTYSYNANGTLASSTDALSNVTTYGYDSYANLTSIAYPAPLGAVHLAYDSLSRLTSYTDGKGQQTTFAYDALDRGTQIAYADSSTVTRAFDGNGNVTGLTDQTGTTTYAFDALSRMTTKASPAQGTMSYGYDAMSNLTSYADGGGTVTYGYNAVNLLSSLTEPGNKTTTFAYDLSYHRTSTTYPNGVTLSAGYDGNHRLTSIVGRNSANAVLTSFTYSYINPSTGQLTDLRYGVTDAAGNQTAYSYDVLSRLVSAVTTNGGNQVASYAYTYDGSGNRLTQTTNGTTTTYSYNGANQLTATGSTTYSYDANGNQTGNGAGLGLAYNAKDQTSSITPSGGSATAMGYNGDSQTERVSAGTTNFSYSLLGLCGRSDPAQAIYYTRDAQGKLISQRTPSGNYYYLFDGQGSVVALTDASGNVVNTYQYDPFGNVVASTETVDNPWKFAGAYWDAAGGLYKIGMRYYDPSIGRWTQQDPETNLSDPRAWNRYVYAGDDPVNFVDPSGACARVWDLWGAVTSWEAGGALVEATAGVAGAVPGIAASAGTAAAVGVGAVAVGMGLAAAAAFGLGWWLVTRDC